MPAGTKMIIVLTINIRICLQVGNDLALTIIIWTKPTISSKRIRKDVENLIPKIHDHNLNETDFFFNEDSILYR